MFTRTQDNLSKMSKQLAIEASSISHFKVEREKVTMVIQMVYMVFLKLEMD